MIEARDDVTLGKLSLTYRVLFTSFLLVIGLGLMMAGAQIMLTHGMADGKPGLSMNSPLATIQNLVPWENPLAAKFLCLWRCIGC